MGKWLAVIIAGVGGLVLGVLIGFALDDPDGAEEAPPIASREAFEAEASIVLRQISDDAVVRDTARLERIRDQWHLLRPSPEYTGVHTDIDDAIAKLIEANRLLPSDLTQASTADLEAAQRLLDESLASMDRAIAEMESID